MKQEIKIRENLNAKLGIWLSGFNRSERLKEHIIMLDWVLNNENIRTIEEIIKELEDKI